jgi:DNA-binding NarL/FixJ family response regulator
MPFDAGRELAALVPGARLVALDGDAHPPYLGDSKAVVQAVAGFLADHDPVPAGAAPPEMAPPATDRPAAGETLSAREVEVLRLIAEGLADAAIAERLVVSPHTVHRHVANIRTKLGQPSRAAAAAYAARRGLI